MSFNIPQINSLKELMNEIAWSWDYPQYDFRKTSEGGYSLNKLCIEPELVTYKTDSWILREGVFEEFEALVQTLNNSWQEDSKK